MISRLRTSVVALAVLATGTLVLTTGTASAAAAPVYDGSTSSQAAESCWAIKQRVPAAASGVYWLQTPALVTAQQFYCDQETDGGGWVLAARGRDGWLFDQNGQGTAADVRGKVTGTEAFTPAALPATTIDGLLNGTDPALLDDGVRVRRAADAAGTTYQDLRLHLAPHTKGSTAWSWGFGGGQPLDSVSLDGTTYTNPGMTTRDWSAAGGDDQTRLFTYEWEGNGYRSGWAYGMAVPGDASPASYLWHGVHAGWALPFTQVWLRPELTDLTYPAAGTTGLPAYAQSPLMSNQAIGTSWGVSGVVGGFVDGVAGEQNIEVQAVKPVGDTIYVGGKFSDVQKGANPGAGDKIAQPYLAAFDRVTGEWKRDFLPKLDGQVWDLDVAKDGGLLVAGEFTNANGVAGTTGLAKLNPTTGAVVDGWRSSVALTNPAGIKVRAMDIQGKWLYVGGNFNRITGGADNKSVRLRNAARVNVATGRPDGVWKPVVNGTVFDVDASSKSDRVYLAGRIAPNADTNYLQATAVAVVSTVGKAELVAGLKPFQPSTTDAGNQYQQAIKEVGDNVWVGGSQHDLQRYSRSDFTLDRGYITKIGGDFQAITVVNGVLYASCHCWDHIYSDAYTYGAELPKADRVDPISGIGAWDVATGRFLPEFSIKGLSARNGDGPWDLAEDSAGCLWFGGDLTGASGTWLGGFGKVCPRDSKSPTRPTSLKTVRNGDAIDLSWNASTDNRRLAGYQILQGGRVMATTTSTSFHIDGVPGSSYWVRAVDAAGNWSATADDGLVPAGRSNPRSAVPVVAAADVSTSPTATPSATPKATTVANPGKSLPKTGGSPTVLLVLAGLLLSAGVLVTVAVNRRRSGASR